jgi:ferredoxin/coenzyme F420-reducing hydrogenase delta subunit
VQIGIFLCSCAGTIDIPLKELKKSFKKFDGLSFLETHDLLCQVDGLNHIIYDVKTFNPDEILIAGCEKKQATFDDLAKAFGLPPPRHVNIREGCGWVHERKDATAKAKGLINLSLAVSPVEERFIQRDVGRSVILIGENEAVRLAALLSNLADVTLISRARGVYGSIGAFDVEFEPNPIDQNLCIECKRCIEVCEDNAILDDVIIHITDSCTGCGKCLSVCPTNAINLEPEVLRVGAGQVILEDEDLTPERLGVHLIGKQDDASIITGVVSLFDGVKKPRYLDYELSECASFSRGVSGCTLCHCPSGAISRDPEGRLAIDEISCEGCGLCQACCPISCIKLDVFSNERILSSIDALLTGASELKRRIILFTSIEAGKELLDRVGRLRLKYPPILPVFLPSNAVLSKEHILRAFDAGADGVVILGECEVELDLLKSCLDGFNLQDRMIEIEEFEPDRFLDELSGFADRLKQSPIRRDEPVELEDFGNRGIFLTLIKSISRKTNKVPEIMVASREFGLITINPSCTICDACGAICPTGALSKDENRIIFDYGICINCGLCEKVCPEGAIEIEAVLDLSKAIRHDRSEVASSELLYCARCGKPYMTQASLERIAEKFREKGFDESPLRYCDRCRPVVTLEKLMEVKYE